MVEQGVHLLRTTDMTVGAIARSVGYEYPATLRTLLRVRAGNAAAQLRGRAAAS